MSTFSDVISDIEFSELLQYFLDNEYYSILFPFLLAFAFLYTVLGKISIFRSKRTGEPLKPAIFVISIIISWFGVSFETSAGYTVGDLLMMMFPNISALTIGILALYLAGALFGKNFFKGLFDKKNSAFMHLAIGGIGLGAVLYYTGIIMGFWKFDSIGPGSYWNFIIAMFLLILGIVFLFVDLMPFGILFLVIFAVYIYNSADGLIIDYVLDPVVFIAIIIIVLLTWLGSDREKMTKLEKNLRDSEKTMARFEKNYGRTPEDYESNLYDITSSNYESNKKKWEKLSKKSWSRK